MYIHNRDQGFPKLINDQGYKIGVEIGVREGFYSECLLGSKIEKLYGVDIKATNSSQKLHDTNYPRYELIIKSSVQASKDFKDDFFDFIHIDADHRYDAVRRDLEAWWPKLKVGGAFTGDDFIIFDGVRWHHGEGIFGVVEAVEKFAKRENVQLFLTGCKDCSTEEKRYEYACRTEEAKLGGYNWYIIK